MLELTCGERIMRCFLGEDIDRVPFGIGLGYIPWGGAMDRWRSESGNPDLDIVKELGFERSFVIPQTNSGLLPLFEPQVISNEGEYTVYRDERGITQRVREGCETMPQYLDYPVKSREDWEQVKSERLVIGDETRILQDWDAFRSMIEKTGEAVQVGNYPFGVFGAVRDLMGVEEMLVSFYTQPELIQDMMQHLTSLWIWIWERVAKEVQIDHIHIWEDMSGRQGSLISPAMVEEYMMPCYNRIVEFGRSVGARVISVDTDGDCSELLPVMINHGINMMLPFEVQAGNDILQFRKQYPELGIYGGLDKRALAKDKAAIDAVVELAAAMVKKGRYVPAFDHLIPPDVPWENFRYACEQLKTVCLGPPIS